MTDEVRLKRNEVVRALRILESIVPSLDRLGSAAAGMTKEEYDRASSEYLDDWDVTRRLAAIRRILSEPFSDEVGDGGADEIERELDGTPCWSPSARKPPDGF